MHVLFSGLTHCSERGPPWVCSSAGRGERKQMLICRVLSMSWVYTQTWTDWDPPDNTNTGLWKKSHVINQKEKKKEKRWRWGKQKGFHIYLFKLPSTTSFPNINGILIKNVLVKKPPGHACCVGFFVTHHPETRAEGRIGRREQSVTARWTDGCCRRRFDACRFHLKSQTSGQS